MLDGKPSKETEQEISVHNGENCWIGLKQLSMGGGRRVFDPIARMQMWNHGERADAGRYLRYKSAQSHFSGRGVIRAEVVTGQWRGWSLSGEARLNRPSLLKLVPCSSTSGLSGRQLQG